MSFPCSFRLIASLLPALCWCPTGCAAWIHLSSFRSSAAVRLLVPNHNHHAVSAKIFPHPINRHSSFFALNSNSDENDTPSATQQPSASTTSSTKLPTTQRAINSIERFARLPVWPVWNGVFIFIVSKLLGPDTAAKLEDAIGGRVCPNFFNPSEKTSPFIMLVHHRHSFAAWDPLRYIQRSFFPEGFPSHPHRGFITLTYFLRGGFLHRDSMGIRQLYGAEERHNGKHTQYLMTGAVLLHEEMYDLQADNAMGVSGQELYQLWLNVPAAHKLEAPFVQLLGGPDETPTVVVEDNKGRVETIVLAGEYQGQASAARLFSEASIFHVQMSPNACWTYNIPKSHATAVLYLRTGSIRVGDETDGETIGTHNTVYFSSYGDQIVLQSNQDGADFLFLSGEPLREPVAAQGSMVMNSAYEIDQAYRDYQAVKMGAPWDHKLSDAEWTQHVQQYPCIYSNARDATRSSPNGKVDKPSPPRQQKTTLYATKSNLEESSGTDKDKYQTLEEVIRLRGRVDTGYGRGGKKLGFPTANLPSGLFQNALADVPCGVYFGWALLEDDDSSNTKQGRNVLHKAVVNVGFSPTFEGQENPEKIVEAHLIFDKNVDSSDAEKADDSPLDPPDFYGEVMRLQLHGFLRPEMKFPSFPDLIAQITSDVKDAKDALDSEFYQEFQRDKFLTGLEDTWIGKGGGKEDASWEFENVEECLKQNR